MWQTHSFKPSYGTFLSYLIYSGAALLLLPRAVSRKNFKKFLGHKSLRSLKHFSNNIEEEKMKDINDKKNIQIKVRISPVEKERIDNYCE